MFESKISSARSSWGQMSSINHTSAPGFVPIPCPTHQQYSITNICKAPNCIEPLCPECIADHVQLHQQTKKAAKIQNIITTKVKCIQQLAKMKYDAQKEIDQYLQTSGGNIEQYLESHQRRLDTAHKKVLKMVDQMFSQMHKQMEIIANAFYFEKDKKERQARTKLSPLTEFVTKLNEYKQELQSQDYIPALIELLNEPPKKPQIQAPSTANNFGEVEINEKKFEDIKESIQKFVKVIVNCKDESKVSLNRSNYHSSNNMKFSRFDRSRDLSRSRDGSSSRMERSNSKKKIFGRGQQSIISQIQPRTHTISGAMGKCIYRNDEKILKIIKPSYFNVKHCCLTYFKQNTKSFFKVDLEYPESGFEKNTLEIPFLIPQNHRTVHSPNGKIFLLGGQDGDNSLNDCYELSDFRLLKALQPMNSPRCRFAACCFNDYLYVFGGLTAPEHIGWGTRKATVQCERYSIKTNRWEKIASMQQPSFGMQVCALQDKILKIGGFTEQGHLINRIDIYNPHSNEWTCIQADPNLKISTEGGFVQIGRNQAAIFGGYDEKGRKTSDCYIVREQNGGLSINGGTQLYNEATFESGYVYDGAIYSIQDADSNRNKLLMGYKHEQWKFVSC